MIRAGAPAAAAVALLALACGVPEAHPLARVAGSSPQGSAVPVGTAVELRFTAPVDGDGLLDGRWLVLAEAAALRQALAAAETDAGASGMGIAVRASLDADGLRVVLRPLAPLRAYTAHAVVLSSRARAEDGRAVLDPEGRHRAYVATFETGAPEGPPPRALLTEVRADADTPEAGGEYVEIANAGPAPLDLAGFRLAKRTASGALAACTIVAPPATAPVAPGGVALVAGAAYDGRYALPTGVPVLACGTSALLGGLANDRAPELLLSDPRGDVVDTLGVHGAPACAGTLEKIDPEGSDEPGNLGCTGGSPGVVRFD